MTLQLYLVQPKQNEDEDAREKIATFIVLQQGFILMGTSYGSLIAAFDDRLIDTVKAHPLVEFASGVTLDPNAPGSAALQQLFVKNMAAQLVERGGSLTDPGQPTRNDPAVVRFPPGYRPLTWHSRFSFDNEEEGGE